MPRRARDIRASVCCCLQGRLDRLAQARRSRSFGHCATWMSAKSLADLPNTTMRSPTAMASSNWCVIRIAVEPHSRASSRKVSRNSAAVTSSRWPKASSASMISGCDREGARDRHALAHAAGQFVRIGIGELAEAQPVQPGQRALALLGFRQADQFERQLGVVERRAPGQQAVLLEHGGDLAAEMIEVGMRALVADKDRAFGRRLQPDRQIEEGRLAAAGLADNGHHFLAAQW